MIVQNSYVPALLSQQVSFFYTVFIITLSMHKTILDELNTISSIILENSDATLTKLLLYGESNFRSLQNRQVLKASIRFIIDSDRFSGSLFLYRIFFIYFILWFNC